MRTKMKTYVANGNNILSASDMKTALDFGIGKLWFNIIKHNVCYIVAQVKKNILLCESKYP